MDLLITNYFKKQLKPHLKKHKFILDDIIITLKQFDKNIAIHIRKNTYKIRLKSQDLKKGKRNSFRLIILLLEVDNLITPIHIYFKGDKDNITKKEIIFHAQIINNEIKCKTQKTEL